MRRQDALRILDANFNRSREGLRVCEEVARFVMDDAKLTAALKSARHAVSRGLEAFGVPPADLVKSRDSRGDVGKGASKLEKRREGAKGLFVANIERAKEALRVLEEASKLVDAKASVKFKKIRFKVYDIEKQALPKLETLRHHGRGRR
jgi:thiamine-phosphate pyrophosphorylase